MSQTLLRTITVVMLTVLSTSAQDLVINVNLRMIDVVVADENGDPVLDLNSDDFEVLANARSLPVRHLSLESAPVIAGLLVDRSSSIKSVKANVDADVSRIMAALHPEDYVYLTTFSGANKLNVNLTSAHQKILPALRKEKFSFGTRFYDLVIDALQFADFCGPERKALIVFSDGADHYSGHTFAQVLDQAAVAGVPVYVFGYVGDDSRTWTREGRRQIREELEQLAGTTGGEACFATSVTQCVGFARQVLARTRYQYHLGFYSDEPYMGLSGVQVKTRRAGARVTIQDKCNLTNVPL
jgi:VWFA-related protein